MLEVKITVELPGIPEALTKLAEAVLANANAKTAEGLANLIGGGVPAVFPTCEGSNAPEPLPFPGMSAEPAPAAEAAEPKRKRASKKAPAVERPEDAPPMAEVPQTAAEPVQAEAPAVTEAATQAEAAPVPEATPEVNTPKYDIDMLSRAGTALLDKGGMNNLLALLAEFGVQSMMELKPEQYPTFAAKMKEIGADLP